MLDSEFIEEEPRPDVVAVAVHLEHRIGNNTIQASAPLAGAEDELEEAIKADAIKANIGISPR